MQAYQNVNGDAGVVAYRITGDALILEFEDGSRYRYDAVRPGLARLREMMRLAKKGEGLTTYINQHVREKYAERLS